MINVGYFLSRDVMIDTKMKAANLCISIGSSGI